MGILNKLFKDKEEGQDKFSNDFEKKNILFKVKKDKKDKRDFHISQASPTYSVPKSFSLLKYCTQIKNQDGVGACTGFSVTGAYEILKKQYTKEILDTSELFSYYNARALEGTTNRDSGATMRSICKTALNDGICLEQFWKFDKKNVLKKPSWIAYLSAHFSRISAYYRCYGEEDIKKAISMGFPVIFGMDVYSNYMDQSGGVYKETKGNKEGGHAQTIVGYDDTINSFLIRNSWGNSWGAIGYCWIDYKLLIELLYDAWAIEIKKEKKITSLLKKLLV